jgi:hypothetical protein
MCSALTPVSHLALLTPLGGAANFCLERHTLPNQHIPQQRNHWIDFLIPFSLPASASHDYVSESHIKRSYAPFHAFHLIDGILKLDEKERFRMWAKVESNSRHAV